MTKQQEKYNHATFLIELQVLVERHRIHNLLVIASYSKCVTVEMMSNGLQPAIQNYLQEIAEKIGGEMGLKDEPIL